jgi:hypothetical protein
VKITSIPSMEARMIKTSRTRGMDAERLRRLCGRGGSSILLVRRVLIVRLPVAETRGRY